MLWGNLKKPSQQKTPTAIEVIEIDSDDENFTLVRQSSESIEADASDDESWEGFSDSEFDDAISREGGIFNSYFKEAAPNITAVMKAHSSAPEPNGQYSANNRSATDVDVVILDSRETTPRQNSEGGSHSSEESNSTSTDGQCESEDQQPSPEQNSSAGLKKTRKRQLRAPKSTTNQQVSKRADEVTDFGNNTRPRRKVSFRDQVDRENFWMVRTKEHIQNALKFCGELDQELSEEERRLKKRRKIVNDQKTILKGGEDYITSCGALEEKVTRMWENS